MAEIGFFKDEGVRSSPLTSAIDAEDHGLKGLQLKGLERKGKREDDREEVVDPGVDSFSVHIGKESAASCRCEHCLSQFTGVLAVRESVGCKGHGSDAVSRRISALMAVCEQIGVPIEGD
jgi:hypothetical protein